MRALFWAAFFLPLFTPLSVVLLGYWVWTQTPRQTLLSVAPASLQLWVLCGVLLVVPALFSTSAPVLHLLGACGRYGVPALVWYFAVRHIRTLEARNTLIQGLLWGAVALSVFAWGDLFVRSLWQLRSQGHLQGLRAQGPAMNANILGAFLVILWPLARWAYRERVMVLPLLLQWGVTGLWWGAILASGSRNAWLAAGVLWVYTLSTSRRTWRNYGLLGLGCGVLMVAFVSLERLLHWHSVQSGWLTGRLTVFRVGLDMWTAHPLTGMGILSVERQYALWHNGWPQVAHLHNALLQVAVESGLPAALFLSVLCIHGIWRFWHGNRFQRAMAMSFTLLGCLSLGDHFLLDFRILWVTTLGVAVTVACDSF